MSGRTLSLVRSIAVVAALFMPDLWLGLPNSARAEDCLAAPDSSAPQGSHWYYRTDRASQQKCWHFRAPGDRAQDATAATSEAAPSAPSPSMQSPATASPSIATAAPAWPQVPQPASTTDNVVQPSARSSLETPAQGRTSPKISAQASEPAPGAPVAWPDPPAAGAIKAQESGTKPIGATDSVHSQAEASAPDDAESNAREAEPSVNFWTIRSLRLTPKVFLISGLGLAVVSALFGILMKMAAARRRRLILNDNPDTDQLDQTTAMTSNETIKTSMAPSMSSNRNNWSNRGRITTPVSLSRPATAEPINANVAPPMSGKRTTSSNREQISTPSHSEPAAAEPIKTNMAPLSGKRTTRPNPEQVAAAVNHSEPTTKADRTNGRDMTEIRKEDDTLAQLNQGLNELLRAHATGPV